jgi:hypothetical protein
LKKGGGADDEGTGGAAMGVGRLEVGDEADGWAPSVGEREREEGGRWWAGVFKWAGRGIGSRLEKEKERGELGRGVGEEGWAGPAEKGVEVGLLSSMG